MVSYLPRGGTSPIRTKFVKSALYTSVRKVDDLSSTPLDAWRQIDLINPVDTNVTMVCGIADHPTTKMNEETFWWHQVALCIGGEMVVQDMMNGNIYRAHEGDLYYWAPGLRMRLGGVFQAFFAKTPIPTRWINTPEGKMAVDMFELENETKFPPSLPHEIRNSEPKYSVGRSRMKFIRSALNTPTVQVSDTAGIMNAWSQIDLVNAIDSDLVLVAGIAEHPIEEGYVCLHRRHQIALILDGEMINEDLHSGEVYRATKGDLLYWPPGLNHRLSGKFKAYFVQTPTNRRWIMTPDGKKMIDLVNLEGEILNPGSDPDEIGAEPLTDACNIGKYSG